MNLKIKYNYTILSFQKSELVVVAFSFINSRPRHQVAFPYHIIRKHLVDSGALWNYKLCSGSSSARASSPPMSSTGITNCTSRHSVLCVQKGRAEALKDTVGLGRNGRNRLEQRSARVNQIRVSPRASCDRHGKLDVEDCSSECLYLYRGYAKGWCVNMDWGSENYWIFENNTRCRKWTWTKFYDLQWRSSFSENSLEDCARLDIFVPDNQRVMLRSQTSEH